LDGAFRKDFVPFTLVQTVKGSYCRRIGRHLGREKKMKWHIDFFLEEAEASGFIPIVSTKKEECSINSKFLENGGIIAKGFGSSDCDCSSHLVYLGDQPHLE
jgi:sugar fermentation stimulation protein A